MAAGGRSGSGFQFGFQAWFAELLTSFVEGFVDAVGIEKQRFARRQGGFAILETEARHDRKRKASFHRQG